MTYSSLGKACAALHSRDVCKYGDDAASVGGRHCTEKLRRLRLSRAASLAHIHASIKGSLEQQLYIYIEKLTHRFESLDEPLHSPANPVHLGFCGSYIKHTNWN